MSFKPRFSAVLQRISVKEVLFITWVKRARQWPRGIRTDMNWKRKAISRWTSVLFVKYAFHGRSRNPLGLLLCYVALQIRQSDDECWCINMESSFCIKCSQRKHRGQRDETASAFVRHNSFISPQTSRQRTWDAITKYKTIWNWQKQMKFSLRSVR